MFSLYKEISFFEQWVGSAFLKNALFLRRGGALTCNRLKKNNYFIKVFSSCLNELQALAITKDYPGFHAVQRINSADAKIRAAEGYVLAKFHIL